jgi:hypothetical protein
MATLSGFMKKFLLICSEYKIVRNTYRAFTFKAKLNDHNDVGHPGLQVIKSLGINKDIPVKMMLLSLPTAERFEKMLFIIGHFGVLSNYMPPSLIREINFIAIPIKDRRFHENPP